MELQVNWKTIPKKFKFAVQYEDSLVAVFTEKPYIVPVDNWITDGGEWLPLEDEVISLLPENDWDKGFIERPEEGFTNDSLTPFKELDAESMKLVVDLILSGRAEYMISLHCWASYYGTNNIYPYFVYREKPIKKQPLIKWGSIPKEYKWFAMDKNGYMEVYIYEPSVTHGKDYWSSHGDHITIHKEFGFVDMNGVEWQDSLTKRPELA